MRNYKVVHLPQALARDNYRYILSGTMTESLYGHFLAFFNCTWHPIVLSIHVTAFSLTVAASLDNDDA